MRSRVLTSLCLMLTSACSTGIYDSDEPSILEVPSSGGDEYGDGYDDEYDDEDEPDAEDPARARAPNRSTTGDPADTEAGSGSADTGEVFATSGDASTTDGGQDTMPEPASCCEITPTPGCEDPEVEACVCGADPFCCDVEWDELCVDQIEQSQCGVCSAGT